MILKGILIVLILIVCPLVTGDAVARLTNTEMYTVFDNIVYKYVFGNVVMWAVFEIIAVPMILMKKSFTLVVYIWCAVLAVILLCDIFLIIYRLVRKGNTKRKHEYELKSIVNKNNIFTLVTAIAAVVLIAYQCYVYVAYMHIDDDDSRFVVNACEAYDNDSMLLINPATGEYEGTWIGELAKDVTSPWSIYVAAVSKLIHIYPTIVFHTIIPVFLLLMAYGVYWLLAKKLFKSNSTQAAVLFVLFAALVNMYFNTSIYTGSTFLLTRIWQGKAVVAGVMLPALFYLLYSYYQNAGYGTYIIIALTNIALCLLSGMGIFFGVIMTAVYGLYYAVVNKKWLGIIWILMTCVPSTVFAFLYATVK